MSHAVHAAPELVSAVVPDGADDCLLEDSDDGVPPLDEMSSRSFNSIGIPCTIC